MTDLLPWLAMLPFVLTVLIGIFISFRSQKDFIESIIIIFVVLLFFWGLGEVLK